MLKGFNWSIVTSIRYLKIAIYALMLAGIIWVGVFLNNNLYKPITQAGEIAELKAKVALITVNKKELMSILELIAKNKELPANSWEAIADPFVADHLPPPPPAPTDEATTPPSGATIPQGE